METISNVASAAAKAVWGTSGEEPVSGEQGNVAAGEPYDAGNIESRESAGVTGSNRVKTGSDRVKPTEQGQTSGYDDYSGAPSGFSTKVATSERTMEETQPVRETSGYDNSNFASTESALRPKKAVSSVDAPSYDNDSNRDRSNVNLKSAESSYNRQADSNRDRSNVNLESAESSSNRQADSNRDRSNDNFKSAESSSNRQAGNLKSADSSSNRQADSNLEGAGPAKTKDSSATNNDQTKAQADVRSPTDSGTDPKESAARSNVDDKDGGLDKADNPAKVDGPGPRPVAEVAKEHGGDAGRARSGENAERGAKNSGDDEDDDGPQKVSHGEGTGEKYVKSSGLASEGGDFDASQPGAGREADRLLDEHGVQRELPGKQGASTDEHSAATGPKVAGGDHAVSGDQKEKRSFGDKIKDKLHRH